MVLIYTINVVKIENRQINEVLIMLKKHNNATSGVLVFN
jgi:hypothetical protein